MEKLLEKAKVDLGNKKPEDVYSRLPQMKERGELAKATDENDTAFIMLKRWLSSVEWLKKTKWYRERRKQFDTYASSDQIERVKCSLQELEKKLRAFYAPKHTVMEVDGIADGRAFPKDKSMEATLNLPETPTDDPVGVTETEEFLSCIEFFNAMQQKKRLLIIDTRPQEDYFTSRIKSEQCVNIPEGVIAIGMIGTHFEKKLHIDKQEYYLFTHRSTEYVDAIVLLDWSSTRFTLFPDNKVRILKDILQKWDPGVSKGPIMILDGGYTEWLNRYPTYVTNPNIKAPDLHSTAMDEILEDVKYPEWLCSDHPSSSFNALKIQPDISKQNTTKIIIDRLKKDEGISSYNTDDFRNTEQDKNRSNVFTYQNDIRDTRNSYDKPNKFTRKLDNRDAEHMYLDDDEDIYFQTTKLSNKSTLHNVIPKPTIDRTSKPSNLSIRYADCKNLLILMKQLYELIQNQEKIEKEILNIEMRLYGQESGQYSNDSEYPSAVKEQLTMKLEELKLKKAQVIEAMAIEKVDESTMSPKDKIVKDKLDLNIGSIQQRLKIVSIRRKHLHAEYNEKRNKIMLTPMQNENGVYKEPLKSDSASNNSGLKRSHSSPNLAQVKKLKVQRQLEDRRIPRVDRSSKPPAPNLQIPSRARNNINNKINALAWKDREQRMDPIFRNGHPGITGLKNLGNSCYMNSIIQCLSNTAYLAKYFNDNVYLDDLNTTNDNENQGQVVEEVAQVIKALWRGQYKSISPRDLKVVIGQYKLQFDTSEQQDSHEFLTFLLDWMHNDLKKAAKIRFDGPLSTAQKEWDKAMESQRSVISHLFFGQLRSSIVCATCGNSSITYETFNSLTMSLPHTNRCTLDDCVKKYVSGQKVSGWKCPICKVPREATKKFDFVKLAPIVVIHLNRFAESDGWLKKKDTLVDFPLTDFNLKPYLVGNTESANAVDQSHHNSYSLYAVSNHYGTMDGGHYTAFCKSAAQNKWYKYDDQMVTDVSPNQVKSQNASAYLLFYTSISSEPYTYI